MSYCMKWRNIENIEPSDGEECVCISNGSTLIGTYSKEYAALKDSDSLIVFKYWIPVSDLHYAFNTYSEMLVKI